ncbi:MAG: hypothetical protein EXS16_04025 [Gemmataceae bacterium]|nr:hypothetical protein [Gemmataceae bacterium]
MKKRRLLLIGLAIVSLLALGVYDSTTHVVRGKLRGEAFFDGRPTSWWRAELLRWRIDLDFEDNKFAANKDEELLITQSFFRERTTIEKFADRWLPIWKLNDFSNQAPAIIQGDPNAAQVLRELADDDSQMTREFVELGLWRIENWR